MNGDGEAVLRDCSRYRRDCELVQQQKNGNFLKEFVFRSETAERERERRERGETLF
jgi:hypothetical protein